MTEPQMTHEQARDLAAGYVLGALERTDEAAVRAHLASCGLPHPEFDALGGVVPMLVDAGDLELVEPPTSLRDRIMAAAADDLAARPRGAASAAREPIAFPTAAQRETRAGRSGTSRFDWALRIAAVLAIVAVGAWGLNLQRQLDASRSFETAVATVVQTASKPGSATVVLAPTKDATASGIAAVAPDGSVVMAVRDLAPTSGSQVYEAWVIVGKAAPVPVGGFTVGSTGTAAFTTEPSTTPAGAIIALSLEPAAGSTAPVGPIVSTGLAVAPPAPSS